MIKKPSLSALFISLAVFSMQSYATMAENNPSELCAVTKIERRRAQKDFFVQTNRDIQMRVIFYTPKVFRLVAAPKGQFQDPLNNPERAQMVLWREADLAVASLKEDEQKAVFTTSDLIFTINKKDSTCELRRADGTLLWRELKPIRFGKETLQTLSSDLDEQFFGGGQQNGYFTHKGTQIDIVADGNWNEGGHPNPAPFYMSNKGYGCLRHTFSVGAYNFKKNDQIETVHRENRFDAFYFVGQDFKEVVDLYTQFTGRPNFMPIWALEMGEADAYMTRDPKTKELVKDAQGNYVEITPHVIKRLAEKYRENDFPGGWILPNDGYGCGYVELERVVKELKALGFYTGLWTEGELTKTKWEVGTAGTRVQKLDVAWTGPAYQHALNCNQQAWESLVRNSDSRGMVWTVQGWAGTQRYGICWTGDQYGTWDLIRYHIPTLTGSGMSGQAYATTDVDGIFGGSSETYTRDLQWKCFTPVLYAMNGWAGKINKSPFAYEEPYKSINRRYLKLKMRLTPYMYKYCKDAYDTGAPITRAMVWNYPNDKKTWDRSTQYQYMLGDSLLIAPVFTSMKVNKGWRKEDIYLPAGQWIDYWDGRRVNGPYTIDAYPITLEKLPIFVKAGAIIPMYPEMLYNNQKAKDPLTLAIYPYGNSSFELYEDDGLTRKYQQGEFSKQKIEVKAPEGKAGDISVIVHPAKGEFTGKLATRIYEFEIHSELKPLSIIVNGERLLEVSTLAILDHAVEGWYYNPTDRRGVVYVKLARRSTNETINLNLDIDENAVWAVSPAYPVPVETPELDKTEFVVTTNSDQGNSISSAFDGTLETMWHSNYSKQENGHAKKHPYIVNINLKGLYAVNGFQYLARQDLGNGMINEFELYVSRNPEKMGEPVYKGAFKAIKDLQTIKFPAVWGEYVQLKILSGFNGNQFASAAEFDVLRDLKAAPLADEVVYLSDLAPTSFIGKFNNDKSIGNQPLKVNDQNYAKGIGALSGSELTYTLDGTWDRLAGHVGMDDEVGDAGTVMFRVYADNNLIFESPKQTGASVKQLMELNIKGVKILKLVLLDCGDGSEKDHGDWVDVKLIRNGSK